MSRSPLIISRLLLLLGTIALAAPAGAAGSAPDPKSCASDNNPRPDEVTQGGCVAILRTKGYCQACHEIPGIVSGNIAPSLAGVAARHPDRVRLRAQIENPAAFNPTTIMPPFGKHGILTQQELDLLMTWLLTL